MISVQFWLPQLSVFVTMLVLLSLFACFVITYVAFMVLFLLYFAVSTGIFHIFISPISFESSHPSINRFPFFLILWLHSVCIAMSLRSTYGSCTGCITVTLLIKRKWFEPRSYIPRWNSIIRVKGFLRRTLGSN